MHRNIKRYTQEGEVRDDADFIRLRSELERVMMAQIKEEGYLPVFELNTEWSTKLTGKKYQFKLSMYAAYAGKRKAQEYGFWSEGRLVRV